MSPLPAIIRHAALTFLPFAVVFTTCIALSPRAAAQYYFQPTPGWHPLKPDGSLGNDTLADPYTFYDYDWTRLSLNCDGIGGPPYYSPYSFTFDYSPDTCSGYQYVSGGPPPYPGQPPPPAGTMTLTIKGTSTIKYSWVPPSNPATAQPDSTNFPAPPLFVLGRVDGQANADASNTAGDLTGITGSGSFNDGFGGPPHLYASVPGDTSYQVGRKVLAASGSPAQITMSPLLTAKLKGTGTGSAFGGGWVEERAFPITLASPNPLTNPALGDGSNQFTYTLDPQDGYLYVPGALRAIGASSADMQWLLASGSVDMAIDNSVIPNTFVHGWTISGDTLFINTPNNGYPGYIANRWIFKGLPVQNSSFGNHDVNLYVNGIKTQKALIQTFFPKDAQNFPGCDPAWDNNWYHYYNQIYPSPDDDPSIQLDGTFAINKTGYGECEFQEPLNHDPIIQYGYGIGGWLSEIHIHNQAGGSTMLPVFDLGGAGGQVRYIGRLYTRGIHTYILTCAHETAHRTLMQSGIYYPYIASNGPPATFTDKDGDGLDDNWEQQHHLDPTLADTTGYYQNNASYRDSGTGDTECLCEILALKGLLRDKDYWKQDWSDLGIQNGAGPEPDFYWRFIPSVTSSDYVVGTEYHVRSLSDLQQRYPTVLTDLP